MTTKTAKSIGNSDDIFLKIGKSLVDYLKGLEQEGTLMHLKDIETMKFSMDIQQKEEDHFIFSNLLLEEIKRN